MASFISPHWLRFGVSWSQFAGKKIDIDAAISVFDGYGSLIDVAYFNNPVALGGTLTLSFFL